MEKGNQPSLSLFQGLEQVKGHWETHHLKMVGERVKQNKENKIILPSTVSSCTSRSISASLTANLDAITVEEGKRELERERGEHEDTARRPFQIKRKNTKIYGTREYTEHKSRLYGARAKGGAGLCKLYCGRMKGESLWSAVCV